MDLSKFTASPCANSFGASVQMLFPWLSFPSLGPCTARLLRWSYPPAPIQGSPNLFLFVFFILCIIICNNAFVLLLVLYSPQILSSRRAGCYLSCSVRPMSLISLQYSVFHVVYAQQIFVELINKFISNTEWRINNKHILYA
ncbi:hypothetical protein H1C71_016108 [Ictidomys tridecemlineatus]|nr:hypothetical protein H1C71_016108 [Ictidomys tridecemlineatus]